MTNNLFSVIDAPARREAPCPNPHIVELREVFALACHFVLSFPSCLLGGGVGAYRGGQILVVTFV